MRLPLSTFLIGSVPNTVEHTVTTLLSSNHTDFISSLRSVFLSTAAQISPRLVFFVISLMGTNWRFLSTLFLRMVPVASCPISLSFKSSKLEGRKPIIYRYM